MVCNAWMYQIDAPLTSCSAKPLADWVTICLCLVWCLVCVGVGIDFACVWQMFWNFQQLFLWIFFFWLLWWGDYMTKFRLSSRGGLFNGAIKPVLKGSPVHKRAIFLHISAFWVISGCQNGVGTVFCMPVPCVSHRNLAMVVHQKAVVAKFDVWLVVSFHEFGCSKHRIPSFWSPGLADVAIPLVFAMGCKPSVWHSFGAALVCWICFPQNHVFLYFAMLKSIGSCECTFA